MRIAVLHAGGSAARDYFEPFVFPNGHVVGGVEFFPNPTEGQFDGVVVPQSMTPLNQCYELVCPPTKTLCALLEPPDILTLPDEYTEQFYAVVGPDPRVSCKNLLMGAAGHHWFVEITAQRATSAPITAKPKLISAVVSSKRDTPGHRARFGFLRHLKDHFGDRLAWFGRGVMDTGASKLVALSDYKYHIVLENCRWPHYWTEKLSDAFMANAFPFYWGAPNIAEYFDRSSYCPIDPLDPRDAINKIEAAIQANLWEARQKDLAQARAQVATQYHPYEIWRSIFESLPASAPRLISIKPFNQCAFSRRQHLRLRLRNFLQLVAPH
jgi:hypothetical protein